MPSTNQQSNVDPIPEPITSQSSGGTAWGLVLLAIGSGMLAAVQVGKAHIALMSIRSSFALSLVDASWILSALSFVGLVIAAPIGSVATRFGTKHTLTAGLLILSASSVAGGFAPTAEWPVASRVVEGLGFVLVVVAAPSLIVEVTQRRHIRLALAGWATFMPGGIALATLLALPVLNHHTWRVVWFVDAGFLAAYVLFLFGVSARTGEAARPSRNLQPFVELRAVITSRGPRAACFHLCPVYDAAPGHDGIHADGADREVQDQPKSRRRPRLYRDGCQYCGQFGGVSVAAKGNSA
jgi:MFS transporter, DHA1 family, inner membrane transport protein